MADEVPTPANYIVLPFADGDYTFKLGVEQAAELQTKCDAGVGEIMGRLLAGRYRNERTGEAILNILEARFRQEDVREVMRLGLIGGGEGMVDGQPITVNPVKALHLVRNYVDARPLQENWANACAIMSAFMVGYTDPAAEKKTEPKGREEPEKTAAGSA